MNRLISENLNLTPMSSFHCLNLVNKESEIWITLELRKWISFFHSQWMMVIMLWLTSQSRCEELESGEAFCLPLLSQSALFVTCHHRLSHHRPCTLLSILHPSILPFPHILSTSNGKHVILRCSNGAKRAPPPPEGALLFYYQSMCSTCAFSHPPIYPSSCLRTLLYDSVPTAYTPTEDF